MDWARLVEKYADALLSQAGITAFMLAVVAVAFARMAWKQQSRADALQKELIAISVSNVESNMKTVTALEFLRQAILQGKQQ